MKQLLRFINTTKLATASIMVIMLAPILVKPVHASEMYELVVTYTNGATKFGPLSFGLSALPASVTATFSLGAGQTGGEPGEENEIFFESDDVISANVVFGDATWSTGNEFDFFFMSSTSDVVNSLSYAFLPTTFSAAAGGIVMNFPLRIMGTDVASQLPFEYEYTTSTQTLTPTVQTLDVAIDIKPGSDKNCFNINGHGVVPVAILGNMDFDVSQVDVPTLSFGGLAVRVRGNKGALCAIEYSNQDEYLDLVCHFEDDSNNWDAGDGDATVTGSLIDGTNFEGSDSICVVP